MRVILVGGGEVAYFLARAFLSKGYPVSVINSSREQCEQLAKSLNVLAIHGDATDPKVLEDAGAREAQLLLAVTPFDHINLVTCQTAYLLYKVPKTLAMVGDPDNYEVFKKLGVHHVFNQTDLIVNMLERSADVDYINHLLTYAGGAALFNEVTLNSSMPSVGKEIGQLGMKPGARILGVLKNKIFTQPERDLVLEAEDQVLLMTTPESHAPTLRILCGKEA